MSITQELEELKYDLLQDIKNSLEKGISNMETKIFKNYKNWEAISIHELNAKSYLEFKTSKNFSGQIISKVSLFEEIQKCLYKQNYKFSKTLLTNYENIANKGKITEMHKFSISKLVEVLAMYKKESELNSDLILQ